MRLITDFTRIPNRSLISPIAKGIGSANIKLKWDLFEFKRLSRNTDFCDVKPSNQEIISISCYNARGSPRFRTTYKNEVKLFG